MVDYCKLLSKENDLKSKISDCLKNGNDQETVLEMSKFDVPLVVPEGYLFW